MKSLIFRLAGRWATFTAAPHRMFFFTGTWQLVAISTWWAALLCARATGHFSLEPVLPGLFLHGGFALFLLFTPFITGFLLTVYSRWQPAPPVPRRVQLLVYGFMNTGQVLVLAGACTNVLLLGLGLVVLALAWITLIGALLVSLLAARERVVHAVGVLAGLLGGFAGLLLYLHAVLSGDWQAWPLIRALGLWGFLLPVYASVCHRMVPFFSSRIVPGYTVYRPVALLWLVLALGFARALLETAGPWRWLASLPLAVVLAVLVVKWRPRARYDAALLKVLHLSLFWLAGGVGLQAVQDIVLAWSGNLVLARAPLHALGVGFFGGMLLSMVTRVSLGHSGRPLEMDRFTWLVFWLVQASVAFRVTAELPELVPGANPLLVLLAAIAWLAAFLAWGWRYGRIYWQPRADGAPG